MQFVNSFNKIVSTLFTVAITFSMSQVSDSYSHKDKKWLRKIKL